MKYKGSKVYSILNNKCPRCRESTYYITNNPYNLRKFATSEKGCAKCHFDFRQEPGFYFGATYVSYVMQVVVMLTCYLIFYLWLQLELWKFVTLTACFLILLIPLTFRISRLTWLTLFGDYTRNHLKKEEQK